MKEKVKEIFIKNLKWIILFICLVGFLALAEDVFHKEIMSGDIVGYNIISKFLISFKLRCGTAVSVLFISIYLKKSRWMVWYMKS